MLHVWSSTTTVCFDWEKNAVDDSCGSSVINKYSRRCKFLFIPRSDDDHILMQRATNPNHFNSAFKACPYCQWVDFRLWWFGTETSRQRIHSMRMKVKHTLVLSPDDERAACRWQFSASTFFFLFAVFFYMGDSLSLTVIQRAMHSISNFRTLSSEQRGEREM